MYNVRMSIVAFKKKSVIRFGSNVSGKRPGGYWLSQGPFGDNKKFGLNVGDYGPVGFSLNGGRRNVGYIGKSSHMSKQGTRFNGQYPYGSGGRGGTYAQPTPVFNINEVYVLANQYQYIKPTVLTTSGMLRKRFECIYNGQYPKVWVQPNYTGNLTDNTSQGSYIQTLSAANTCVSDINQPGKYANNLVGCSPGLEPICKKNASKNTYNGITSSAPYTKYTNNPIPASTYTLQVQRKCANPTPAQMPWPPATNGNVCNALPPVLRAPSI